MKVIGAGLGRAGTSSLQTTLEELLEGKCYHMKTILLQPNHLQIWHNYAVGKTSKINWEKLFKNYTASVDFPVCIVLPGTHESISRRKNNFNTSRP